MSLPRRSEPLATCPGAGEIMQLSVHPALQSCGIGTILIQELT
jgi:ribosomal protein S18 acetylase RimI-like enzyme